jgi:hypothetical protein
MVTARKYFLSLYRIVAIRYRIVAIALSYWRHLIIAIALSHCRPRNSYCRHRTVALSPSGLQSITTMALTVFSREAIRAASVYIVKTTLNKKKLYMGLKWAYFNFLLVYQISLITFFFFFEILLQITHIFVDQTKRNNLYPNKF